MTYLEWLVKSNFQQDGKDTWSRETKLGAVKCKENGKLKIVVTRHDDLFQMSVRGFTGVFWTDIAVYQLNEDTLIRRGGQIEMRLVDAWREFN